uniref:Uncharacterized protein n=1 Tax=Siphoviridae sp. ctB242 TaxID=2827800 RepID=A0A8S5T125_9CAUD|nr:MAG TPA: hypothetical protein [Siphoviridae sp. ctB242]DAY04090.1 MAG TPA: hypothetical protein [Caudoviricetes sp.]
MNKTGAGFRPLFVKYDGKCYTTTGSSARR